VVEKAGFSPATGQKNGQFDQKRKLNGINLQFSGMVLSSAILLGFVDSTKIAGK
jgi:hypothetical protein